MLLTRQPLRANFGCDVERVNDGFSYGNTCKRQSWRYVARARTRPERLHDRALEERGRYHSLNAVKNFSP